jgi:ABC-type multidrug transport system fused ATPase/permease subunit
MAVLQKRERKQIALHVVYEVGISILDLGSMVVLLLLLRFYLDPQGQVPSWIPAGFPGSDPVLVFGWCTMLFALKNFLAHQAFRQRNAFVYGVAGRLSEEKLDSYFHSEYQDYVQVDSSEHIRKISYQPVEFANYVLRGLQLVAGHGILVSITILTLLWYNPQLLLQVIFLLFLPLFVGGYVFKKKLEKVRNEAREAGEKSLRFLKEALSGYIESRIFFKKVFFISRYMKAQSKLHGFLAGQQVVQAFPARFLELVAVAGIFLIILLSRQEGTALFMTTAAFCAAAYKIIPGLSRILNGLEQMKTYRFVTLSLLSKSPAKPGLVSARKEQPIKSIEFNKVEYSFGENKILSPVSFSIGPGSLVGISGLSGVGKTTLVNLLLGFLSPTKGKILVNGMALEEFDKEEILKRVSYVKQQPFILHDTVYENVVMGAKDADQVRFHEIGNILGLGSFGDNGRQVIRENGRNISGGQRQRIALARAFYKTYDLLILDEPFSELDLTSEQKLLLQLREQAAAGKIIMLITHRGLEHCNQIIRLDHES